MRIATNQPLVERNKRIAGYMFFFSVGALGLGFVVTNARFLFPDVEANLLQLMELVLPLLILPIALGSTLFSVRMTNLWVRLPRPEKALEENLKGMGSKAVLYNYYHFPARHVLICPHGVFAIVTRFQNGNYVVNGDRWSTQKGIFGAFLGIFRMDRIGNPSADAIVAADDVKKALASIAPDVPVQPVVVFVDPRATLTLNDPTVPVVYVNNRQQPNLKEYVRTLPKSNPMPLTAQQIQAFETATGVTDAGEDE